MALTSCATTQVGVSKKQSGYDYAITQDKKKKNEESSVQVIDTSFDQAVEIAAEVSDRAFSGEVRISHDKSIIYASNKSFWAGDIEVEIEPLLIQEKNSKRTGVTYHISSKGVGFNASLTPGYGQSDFFNELDEYLKQNSINYLNFKEYEILKDKGIIQFVPASIPTSFVGFRKFIDDNENLMEFEGIWSTTDNRYTLGLYYDPSDPQYRYKAFVIESSVPAWEPGEVKIKFTRLQAGKVSIAKYHMRNGSEIGTTWNVEEDIIATAIPIGNVLIAIIKQYPSDYSTPYAKGSGTAWLVSPDGVFVTNAHVVEKAKEIYIGHRDRDAAPARVMLMDKRTDLALVKISKPLETLGRALPLNNRSVSNGTIITVIGYPKVSDLGDKPRVNDGIISAQSGIKDDITRYQISAAINPGNSGGPVLSSNGEVVGVAVEKLSDGEATNFAIKSGYVLSMIEQLGIPLQTMTNHPENMNHQQIFEMYKDSVLPIWVK